MRRLSATIAALACAALPCAVPAEPAGSPALPGDVRAFIARRDGCDHFRGEDSPDPSRAAQIARELDRLCAGTDAELARLKRLHARDSAVQRALAGYDPHIE